MLHDMQEAVCQMLIEWLGVPEPVLAVHRSIHFRWFGYDYAMDCQSSMWLNLGIALHDLGSPRSNPLHRLDMSGVSRDEIFVRVGRLNGLFPHLRFSLPGERHLKVEWTGALFGRLVPLAEGEQDPMPPAYALPVVARQDAVEVLCTAMALLNAGMRSAFQAFGQESLSFPRTFPSGVWRTRPDSLPLFRQAVQRNGLRHTEISTPLPKIYFLDSEGYAFHLLLGGHQGGGYALQMEFQQAARINPNGSPINLIDGVVDARLVEACDDVGCHFGSVKAFASAGHGFVVLGTGGLLPAEDLDRVVLLLPVLMVILAEGAKALFSAVGVRTRSWQERVRQTLQSDGAGIPHVTDLRSP